MCLSAEMNLKIHIQNNPFKYTMKVYKLLQLCLTSIVFDSRSYGL